MANTKSAKKANRASLHKRVFNQAKENKIRETLKNFKKSVVKEGKDIEANLSKVFSALDKAVKTKFVHKKTAARRKSRLVAMARKAVAK